MEMYVFFSTISALAIWCGMIITTGIHYSLFPLFPSIFLIGNYLAYIHFKPFFEVEEYNNQSDGRAITLFFLFQVIALSGMGIEYQTRIPMFAAYPMALMAFLILGSLQRKKNAFIIFAIPTIVSFFAKGTYPGHAIQEQILLISFACWMVGVFLTVSENSLFLFKKKDLKKRIRSRERRDSEKDRLFFHDIINQTHGISLFLNHTISLDKGFSKEEGERIFSEIKTLQALFKDHFGYPHKNLSSAYKIIPFSELKPRLSNLIGNYITRDNIKWSINYDESLSDHEISKGKMVHLPSFIRIMTNIVKNIVENHSYRIEFFFSYNSDKSLKISVKNYIFYLHEDKKNLMDNLQKIILSDDHKSFDSQERTGKTGISSQGLASIGRLCEEQGGSFRFFLDEGEDTAWVTEVILPNPSEHKDKKMVA